MLLLCSGSGGGRDEWSPAVLHPSLHSRGPGRAGSGRANSLRALEGKQTQTLLLRKDQPVRRMCFNEQTCKDSMTQIEQTEL